MTDKYKTLRELADENGFPFDAYGESGNKVKFFGYNLEGVYIVGQRPGMSPDTWNYNDACWTLAPKQKQAVEFLYEERSGKIFDDWVEGSEKNAHTFCNKHNYKFIKILRTELIGE